VGGVRDRDHEKGKEGQKETSSRKEHYSLSAIIYRKRTYGKKGNVKRNGGDEKKEDNRKGGMRKMGGVKNLPNGGNGKMRKERRTPHRKSSKARKQGYIKREGIPKTIDENALEILGKVPLRERCKKVRLNLWSRWFLLFIKTRRGYLGRESFGKKNGTSISPEKQRTRRKGSSTSPGWELQLRGSMRRNRREEGGNLVELGSRNEQPHDADPFYPRGS